MSLYTQRKRPLGEAIPPGDEAQQPSAPKKSRDAPEPAAIPAFDTSSQSLQSIPTQQSIPTNGGSGLSVPQHIPVPAALPYNAYQQTAPPPPQPPQQYLPPPEPPRMDQYAPSSPDRGRYAGRDQLNMRVLVSAHAAGRLIGRGGASINKMRQDSGANIRCPDSEGASKRIFLVNGSLTQVYNALRALADRLAERGDDMKDIDADEREYSITVLVPNVHIGGILGKKGTRISETREKTRAKIKISTQPLEDSTEKSVLIQGNPECVHHALSIICEQIAGVQRDSPDLENHIPYVPRANRGGSFASHPLMLQAGSNMFAVAELGMGAGGGSNSAYRSFALQPTPQSMSPHQQAYMLPNPFTQQHSLPLSPYMNAPVSPLAVLSHSLSPQQQALTMLQNPYALPAAAAPSFPSVNLASYLPNSAAAQSYVYGGSNSNAAISYAQTPYPSLSLSLSTSSSQPAAGDALVQPLQEQQLQQQQLLQQSGSSSAHSAEAQQVTQSTNSLSASNSIASSGATEPSLQPGPMMSDMSAVNSAYATAAQQVLDRLATTTQVIQVSSDLAGGVIGKGGSTIKMIRERTGAMVRIADPKRSERTRAVTITGSHMAVEMAVMMVHQAMQAPPPRR